VWRGSSRSQSKRLLTKTSMLVTPSAQHYTPTASVRNYERRTTVILTEGLPFPAGAIPASFRGYLSFIASVTVPTASWLESSRGCFSSRAARFRLEWDTGVILPVSVWHLSPGLAPQAGHSKSIAFMVTFYAEAKIETFSWRRIAGMTILGIPNFFKFVARPRRQAYQPLTGVAHESC
jgi:hypothetical protein